MLLLAREIRSPHNFIRNFSGMAGKKGDTSKELKRKLDEATSLISEQKDVGNFERRECASRTGARLVWLFRERSYLEHSTAGSQNSCSG